MNQNSITDKLSAIHLTSNPYLFLLRSLFAGILIPLGFAPFHFPGLCILGMALLYAQLYQQPLKKSFLIGFVFGLGFLGFGVSWVFVSIHVYGHLNSLLSAFITLLFIVYLSLYPGLVALLFSKLSKSHSNLLCVLLFSSLWSLGEYLRGTMFSGFPWLTLGFGQIDSPLKYLLPVIGIYGVSFFTCVAAACLATSVLASQKHRLLWLFAFVALLITPNLLKNKSWTHITQTPVSVGIIQANISMRDKWDESLFWQLLNHYQSEIEHLIDKKALIVMPESAIPVPEHLMRDFLDNLHVVAKNHQSALLLGIPQSTDGDALNYYNSIISLGTANGHYLKQHLVPFGEYIPKPFFLLIKWLSIPIANLKPGHQNQSLIQVHQHPIASLICYELAYPMLLRQQLPQAEWIVSLSDDGWFGHSLAMYQQLQMSEVLSLQTGRYQVVSNNDGLSSIIDAKGHIISSLPAFSAGVLEENIYPATGMTPWTLLGDYPILLLLLLTVLYPTFRRYVSFAKS